jgi:hypothetical protein
MKLRTEMTGPDSTSEGPYPAARVDDDGQDYLHDAAAAHALMRAVNHVDSPYQGLTHQAQWILRRADELMAEWGFDK